MDINGRKLARVDPAGFRLASTSTLGRLAPSTLGTLGRKTQALWADASL